MRTSRDKSSFVSLLGLWLVSVACSGAHQPRQAFVVNVRGTRAALSQFVIETTPRFERGELKFAGSTWRQSYSFEVDPLAAQTREFVFESRADDVAVSSVRLEPFVCSEMPDAQARSEQGWSVVETQEISLTNEGGLRQHPMLGFLPSNTCEMSAPDDANGDGLGTFLATPSDCSQPDRAGTRVVLTGNDGRPSSPATCVATSDASGNIVVTLTFDVAGREVVTVQLGYCPGMGDEPPFEATPPATPASCRFGSGAERTRAGEINASYTFIEGSWTLQPDSPADLPGRLAGEAAITLRSETEDLRLEGTLDLPLILVDL